MIISQYESWKENSLLFAYIFNDEQDYLEKSHCNCLCILKGSYITIIKFKSSSSLVNVLRQQQQKV